MGNVNAAGIWTPDEGDNLDPEVWSGTMADSIENGIAVRLAKQELSIGCFLNIQDPDQIVIPHNTFALMPFAVGAEMAYIDGMELAGGILTVSEAGYYTVSANAVVALPDGYGEINVLKNGVRHGQNLAYKTADPFVGIPPVVTAMKLVPGDQISVGVGKFLGNAGTTGSLNLNWDTFNTLSVSMTSAFPA